MLGNFNPSKTYEMVEKLISAYETPNTEVYYYTATDAVIGFLSHSGYKYLLTCASWPNEEGGVCSACWVEDGQPQMIVFDYVC